MLLKVVSQIFFSFKNFCLATELWLIHPIFIWLVARVYIKYGQKNLKVANSVVTKPLIL